LLYFDAEEINKPKWKARTSLILTLSLFSVFDSELKIHYTNIASRTATGSTRNSLLVRDGKRSLTVPPFSLTSRASAVAKNTVPRPANLAFLSPASAGRTTPWPMATAYTSMHAAAPQSAPDVAA
jgi:hypothetical protein